MQSGEPSRRVAVAGAATAAAAATPAAGHRVVLQPGELHRPEIAWPTLLLAAVALALWAAVAVLGAARGWPLHATLLPSVLAVYMTFPPMHEAAHGSVFRGHRRLNDVVGWLCCAPFFGIPYPAWRVLHLEHHKHTNEEELDPDHTGLTHALLSTLAVVPQYVAYVARDPRRFGDAVLLQSALLLAATALAVAAGVRYGHGDWILQFWVLPAVLGIFVNVFVLDFVAHVHLASRKDSAYGCTAVVDGWLSVGSGDSSRLLTCLLIGQNYHAMHHLYPTLPWYSYGRVWHAHKADFLRAGVPLVSIFR